MSFARMAYQVALPAGALLCVACQTGEAASPVQPGATTGPAEDMRACQTAAECVPVGCVCHCSGCGGLSFEEVVNAKHEALWYELKGCDPKKKCPQVCCPERTVQCDFGTCVVVEGRPE